jgi:hypothetical protein
MKFGRRLSDRAMSAVMGANGPVGRFDERRVQGEQALAGCVQKLRHRRQATTGSRRRPAGGDDGRV